MQRARIQPRLENLEDRCTPAVSVNLTSTALNITGDNDRAGSYIAVSIVNDADTGTPEFQVVTRLNNDTATAVTNFYPLRNNVNIKTGKYADAVLLQGGPLDTPASSVLNINVDLGRGNDSAVLEMNGLTITGNSKVSVNVKGGEGNDTITADLAGTIDAGSTLSLNLDGGHDRDTITVGNLQGRLTLNGTLNVSAYGSSDRDVVAADLIFQPLDGKTTQGVFNGYLKGGLGKDNLRLTVANIASDSGNVKYNGRIDAGPLDTVFASVGTVIKHALSKKTTLLAVLNELPVAVG